MSKEVHPKKLAIVRLITMVCGQILSFVMMYEYGFFRFGENGEFFHLNLAFAGVAAYCFVFMMMQIRILRKLART